MKMIIDDKRKCLFVSSKAKIVTRLKSGLETHDSEDYTHRLHSRL